jgi:hypothetical protein
MSHIPLNNLPLHLRPIDKRLRNLRRKSAVQHRLQPDPASIKRAFGPERWQHWSRDALLRVRDVRLRERFLLGRVGVVEEVGDDWVEDEEAGCRLRDCSVSTPSWQKCCKECSYDVRFDKWRPSATHICQLIHAGGNWSTAHVYDANDSAFLSASLAIGEDP